MFPLLIKPTGLHELFLAEEDVGSVFLDLGKGVMLPGSEIFAVGTGWSRDFQSVVSVYPDTTRRLY